MPREFKRTDRVADQIQRELAVMVSREIKDPRLGLITISAVRVSKDFGYADVYYTLLTTEECMETDPPAIEAQKVLQGAAGFLRTLLGKAMKLRVVPQLRFHFDALSGRSRRMDALIDRAVGRKSVVRPDDEEPTA